MTPAGQRAAPSARDLLVVSAADLRTVADLRAPMANTAAVAAACGRLAGRNMIPLEGALSQDSVAAATQPLSDLPALTRSQMDNEELFRLLWIRRAASPALRRYLDTWVRLWLLAPPCGVVESVSAVMAEVWDSARNLQPDSALDELVIRWNGPELPAADHVISVARASMQCRLRTNLRSTLPKDLTSKPCPRASIFK